LLVNPPRDRGHRSASRDPPASGGITPEDAAVLTEALAYAKRPLFVTGGND
jgi:hypothetical protein